MPVEIQSLHWFFSPIFDSSSWGSLRLQGREGWREGGREQTNAALEGFEFRWVGAGRHHRGRQVRLTGEDIQQDGKKWSLSDGRRLGRPPEAKVLLFHEALPPQTNWQSGNRWDALMELGKPATPNIKDSTPNVWESLGKNVPTQPLLSFCCISIGFCLCEPSTHRFFSPWSIFKCPTELMNEQ